MQKIKDFFKSYYVAFKSVPSYLVALSAIAVVLMNLLANKTLYSDGKYLSLDCGFLLSWIMFLAMDVATQRYGPKASFAITVFDIILALLASGMMALVAIIPESSVSGWFQNEDIATALNNVIGNNYLVVLTSLFAFACSSVVDIASNVGFGKLLEKTKTFQNKTYEKSFKGFCVYFVRAYASTFLSQFTDNMVFQSIAYPLLFNMPCTPFSIFMGALVGAVAELIMELIFAPVGFALILKKEKQENESAN